MDENLLELYQTISWGVVVTVIAISAFLIFKKPLGNLIGAIKNFRYSDETRAFSFSTELSDAEELAGSIPPPPPLPPNESPRLSHEAQATTEEFIKFTRVAEIAPGAAIMSAWQKVEAEAMAAVAHLGLTTGKRIGLGEAAKLLRERKMLSSDEERLFNQFRMLRNEAVHRQEVSISEAEAKRYVAVGQKLVVNLQAKMICTERVVKPEYDCPCGAKMKGTPYDSQNWQCESGHRFSVLQAGFTDKAKAVSDDAPRGVVKDAIYVWDETVAASGKRVKGTRENDIGGDVVPVA